MFIPFRYVYPECLALLRESKDPTEFPLGCLQQECSVNKNCAELIAKRINYLFTQVVPQAKIIFAYFKYKDRPASLRIGVFDRELSEPRVIVGNPSSFRKFRKEGETYQWVPPAEYLFMGTDSTSVIPVSNLTKLV